MPKLAIGRRGSVPFAKIMKSNSDDPLTVPNTDTGKFYFNSENQKVGYIRDIFAVEPDFVTYSPSGGTGLSPNFYFIPSGSNKNTCQIMIKSWQNAGHNFQRRLYFQEFFTAQYGIAFFPLVETRAALDYTTTKYRGPWVDLFTGSTTDKGQVYSYIGSTSRAMIEIDSGFGGPAARNRPCITTPSLTNNSGESDPIKRVLVTVFDLPMRDDAIPDNSAAPVSGQEVVRIDKQSSGIARVALPGRTVTDPDPNHFILHENRIPAKVMATGQVTVGAFATVNITTRMPLSDVTYMDFISKKTSEATFWHPPYIDSISAHGNDFTYTMSGSTLTIVSNCDVSMDIIYVVYADTGDAHTTGGKKIFLKSNDGIGDFIQIKRPGSSDLAPNLNDIMVDTRLTYLPILAEGFLNWTSDFPNVMSGSNRFKGVRMGNITVPNPDGLLLFPKVGAVYNLPIASDYNEPSAIWGEHAVFVNDASWAGQTAGYSIWANILSPTSIDLYASNGNPYTIVGGASSYDASLKGVRYYILGLPPSL
ncbi:hypothetical protein [Mesorhizobium sp. M0715]|uniref:hypothetical protein n=1 Tax=Mesorhizobium sp. M0715 TaxID=2956990 RepID=UPI00333934AA